MGSPWHRGTVVITGGTGSFGSALIRDLLATTSIRCIRSISRNEQKRVQLRQAIPDERLDVIGGSIDDLARLREVFAGADCVIHAAALKHVPLAEQDPEEFVRTNIGGSQNVMLAAINTGVKRVVGLSTDKSSAAATLYGATKFVMERMFVAANAKPGSRTEFVCTRYGNVVGSSGSLVPTLLAQRALGVVQLTDPRMTRFWMTMHEAVRLVRRAVELAIPGLTLIPQLPSVRVVDVIAAVAPDCAIETIGIRGVEKIHECLISSDEAPTADYWTGSVLPDLCLGHPSPAGIPRAYDSGTGTIFLTVEDIRARLPGALAEVMT